jgi:hypothetical protein
MDTMNFDRGARAELEKMLARVNGLVINDDEARQLTGESNLVRAADAIRALGPSTVIVKRGEHGALLFDEAGVFAAPAFPLREVQDPTGAGDSFAGGFMGALAASGSLSADALRRAVIYGSVLASFTASSASASIASARSRATRSTSASSSSAGSPDFSYARLRLAARRFASLASLREGGFAQGHLSNTVSKSVRQAEREARSAQRGEAERSAVARGRPRAGSACTRRSRQYGTSSFAAQLHQGRLSSR